MFLLLTNIAIADNVTEKKLKDLKLKGSSIVIKQGTKAKNIRLTDEPGEIECSIDGMKGIVLKTEFIKKA